ncbi:MAG: creatininase family protein [Pseudomonadota bacterium]
MLESFIATLYLRLTGFFDPSSRVYVLYLATAFALAFVAYWQVERAHMLEAQAEGHDEPQRVGFLRYVFNPKIWLHPSSLQDMKYFVINAAVYYALISQFLIGSHTLFGGFYGALTGVAGTPSEPLMSGVLPIILYTIASVIALDFGVYYMHRLFHRIPILWEFHKVHHSAEELNPMTLFRMHPLDLFLTGLVVMVFQAAAFAGFFYLTGAEPQMLEVFGLNVVVFLFYVGGYNLRHSHIWLNYPQWLSRILISPAQHQIHHSSDPKHFDRNFGLIFSFWDQLGGSHYVPVTHEKLKFGLSRTHPNPFDSVGEMYFKPFVWASKHLSGAFASPARRNIVWAGMLVLAGGLLFASGDTARGTAETEDVSRLPSLELEELTWTQVHRAIEAGYTTAIVPTGGTEQNGPFVALGKHNIIVRHTANQVAAQLGGALVAPVMAYVPEGDVGPAPTDHMRWAGTLSLPEPVFEAVLEATARSLQTHGFTQILFMGDSAGNQEAQQRVAAKLSTQWTGQGVRVASLNAYYDGNGQLDHLLAEGWTEKQIGHHAGMRDASEVMALRPDWVRIDAGNIVEGHDTGMSGDIRLASAEIGRTMLKLKVDAAVAQARQLMDEPAS